MNGFSPLLRLLLLSIYRCKTTSLVCFPALRAKTRSTMYIGAKARHDGSRNSMALEDHTTAPFASTESFILISLASLKHVRVQGVYFPSRTLISLLPLYLRVPQTTISSHWLE
ncbi:hypothetical protein P691DRAFT_213781 [Macrolepiota fuliginosa MF-IS2]|uniref:Secreted protein n=1 Tax=Macrolepiota fuliginosa MF-IS2 TaxID=1400762 RepID=A0A9P5X881_9AGAR|nr:hypothetical protein P691DRAFT_213781 [Macrolepiota fuliginosa MF-IS2]